jgi:hypothetical protein
MACVALSEPEGAAAAGAASPMIAAANPLITVVANPNLFMKLPSFLLLSSSTSNPGWLNRQPSRLIPLAEIDRRLAGIDYFGHQRWRGSKALD